MTKLEQDINRMIRYLDDISVKDTSSGNTKELLRDEIKKMKSRAEWDAMFGWAGNDATEEKLGKRP